MSSIETLDGLAEALEEPLQVARPLPPPAWRPLLSAVLRRGAGVA